MQIRSVGIDLGKTTFHLVALGDNGNHRRALATRHSFTLVAAFPIAKLSS
jgi:hypothetical protein